MTTITHPVLTQIIFELEKQGRPDRCCPVPFLRQLISFYGDQMQMVVPSFLEQSMVAFAKEQERFRDQMQQAMVKTPLDMINITTPHQGDGGADPTQCPRCSRTPCACSRPFPMPGADAGGSRDARESRRVGRKRADKPDDLP